MGADYSPTVGRNALILHPRTKDSVVISERQRKNPVVRFLRNVSTVFDADLLPDFLVCESVAVNFLSLQYHRLYSAKYIAARLSSMKNYYKLRVLLVLIDVRNCDADLLTVTEEAFKYNHTLFLAWSSEEAARTLEAFKIYEKKPASFLLPSLHHLSPKERAVQVLTAIPSVNKLDAAALIVHFGTLRKILTASQAELTSVFGIGPKKALLIRHTIEMPFFH